MPEGGPAVPGRRVLVVEDEGLVAMHLEDMLTDLGHQVVASVNRVEPAIRMIAEAGIDLAILDVNLSGERTDRLAEILRDRGIPFVFATGYGSAGLGPEWRDVPVVQKPFRARDLEAVLREELSRNRSANADPDAG